MKHIRFWQFINGSYVRLTLAEGQTIRRSNGGPDEEGWSRLNVLWHYEDGILTLQETHQGCDCDGPYRRDHEYHCRADEVADFTNHEGVKMPNWTSGKASQWDAYAEAAGY